MGIVYVVAALVVVPALLGAFHLLSRRPEVTSQPRPPIEPTRSRADDLDPVGGELVSRDWRGTEWGGVAEEAERWLRSQSSS